MAIVIKKRVSLGFLGDDYKDSYLVFKSVPIREYEVLIPKLDAATDRLDNIKLIVKELEDKFVEGKALDENNVLVDVKKTDLGDFGEDVLARCLATITGMELDPKD